MNWLTASLWAIAAIVSLAVLWALFKSDRPVHTFFSSGLQGLGALVAVNVAGAFTGVCMSLNLLTLVCSVVLGIPGVIMTVLLKTIFAIG